MPNSYGTTTALSGNANSLANNGYASLGVINFGSAPPHECFVEVSVQASAATSGNQQVVLFLRSSVDGTNFSVAPGTNDEPNARFLGTVRLPDTTTRRSVAFAVSPLFGGALPPQVEVFVKNETGVALAATGQVGQFRTETFG